MKSVKRQKRAKVVAKKAARKVAAKQQSRGRTKKKSPKISARKAQRFVESQVASAPVTIEPENSGAAITLMVEPNHTPETDANLAKAAETEPQVAPEPLGSTEPETAQ